MNVAKFCRPGLLLILAAVASDLVIGLLPVGPHGPAPWQSLSLALMTSQVTVLSLWAIVGRESVLWRGSIAIALLTGLGWILSNESAQENSLLESSLIPAAMAAEVAMMAWFGRKAGLRLSRIGEPVAVALSADRSPRRFRGGSVIALLVAGCGLAAPVLDATVNQKGDLWNRNWEHLLGKSVLLAGLGLSAVLFASRVPWRRANWYTFGFTAVMVVIAVAGVLGVELEDHWPFELVPWLLWFALNSLLIGAYLLGLFRLSGQRLTWPSAANGEAAPAMLAPLAARRWKQILTVIGALAAADVVLWLIPIGTEAEPRFDFWFYARMEFATIQVGALAIWVSLGPGSSLRRVAYALLATAGLIACTPALFARLLGLWPMLLLALLGEGCVAFFTCRMMGLRLVPAGSGATLPAARRGPPQFTLLSLCELTAAVGAVAAALRSSFMGKEAAFLYFTNTEALVGAFVIGLVWVALSLPSVWLAWGRRFFAARLLFVAAIYWSIMNGDSSPEDLLGSLADIVFLGALLLTFRRICRFDPVWLPESPVWEEKLGTKPQDAFGSEI